MLLKVVSWSVPVYICTVVKLINRHITLKAFETLMLSNECFTIKDLRGKYYFYYLFTKIIFTRCTHTQVYIRSDLLNMGTSKTYKHFVYCCARTIEESENL